MTQVIYVKKGLYTFKHISTLDNVETTINFIGQDGKEKEKLSLTEIDSFTLNFESREYLLFYMQKIGYKFYNSKFVIEYKNNNETKRIDPVFSDQETLKKFALNNQGNYKIKKDAEFYKYLYYIIEDVANNHEMIYFLRKNNYISEWLYQNIARYNSCKNIDVEASHIYITRIKEELSQYRIIRNIEIGLKEYEKQKSFKPQMEEKKKTLTKKKKTPKNFIEGQGQLFNPDNY